MSYRQDLKRLRRARQQLKHQIQALLSLELAGIITITLHAVPESLNLAIEPETRSELLDLLLNDLRQRRRVLRAEANEVQTDWQQARMSQQPSAASEDELPGPASV